MGTTRSVRCSFFPGRLKQMLTAWLIVHQFILIQAWLREAAWIYSVKPNFLFRIVTKRFLRYVYVRKNSGLTCYKSIIQNFLTDLITERWAKLQNCLYGIPQIGVFIFLKLVNGIPQKEFDIHQKEVHFAVEQHSHPRPPPLHWPKRTRRIWCASVVAHVYLMLYVLLATR